MSAESWPPARKKPRKETDEESKQLKEGAGTRAWRRVVREQEAMRAELDRLQEALEDLEERVEDQNA